MTAFPAPDAPLAEPNADPPVDGGTMYALVDACAWPSEAFWRSFELRAVDRHPLPRPTLELGCGNGRFAELASLQIDEAIDLNPRAVERARTLPHVYARVRCADIRELGREGEGQFGCVFANSVLEHVGELESVLAACHHVLRPGGQLVATVPAAEMNRHLLVDRPWYARWRARHLEHRNLWSASDWVATLRQVGFERVESHPYLSASACRAWDAMDLPGSAGWGRFRVGAVSRRLASRLLPPTLKPAIKRRLARSLSRRAARSRQGEPCATLLIATKRGA